MGREIRRVPLGWEHPTFQHRTRRGRLETRFQPKLDFSYATALSEWEEGRERWVNGQDPDRAAHTDMSYAEWAGPAPDPSFYMPEFEEPCNGWVVYETVSEGTPVSPVFEHAEDLIEYLVAKGDFWDQDRRARGVRSDWCQPWGREAATDFAKRGGWAPTFVIST